MKKKFNYQRYDYSFLCKKNDKYHWLPRAIKVAAKTIGFDLTETKPMNEPTGKLYWVDNYEPVRDINGTWTMTFTETPPPPPTYIRNYDDFVKTYTTASNYIDEWSRRGMANYTVTNSTVADMIKN